MKILIISNMYPSVKDPVYGTFVQTFVEQMKVLNTEGKTNIIVIKGRDGEYGRKLFKYVKFYISIVFIKQGILRSECVARKHIKKDFR